MIIHTMHILQIILEINSYKLSKVREMQISKIIERIKRLDVDYKADLKVFIDEYFRLIRAMREDFSNSNLEADTKYTVQKLQDWLDCYGFDLLYSTIDTLKNDISEEVNGFIEYYSFLLLSSKDDKYSLIDQLFAIPGQFAKEFAEKKEEIVIEY